jgi:hypothetical protein
MPSTQRRVIFSPEIPSAEQSRGTYYLQHWSPVHLIRVQPRKEKAKIFLQKGFNGESLSHVIRPPRYWTVQILLTGLFPCCGLCAMRSLTIWPL